MQYEEFAWILNEKIFWEANIKLLLSIAKNSARFLWRFRPSTPSIKLIQNITQSREIKFWDAMENVFYEYFNNIWFTPIERNITDGDDELDIDQLFIDEDEWKIYLIEQKVRDDHDSTKKKWQFDNFVKKYNAVNRQYWNEYTVVPIMRFIDDSLDKNKNYYEERMETMRNEIWWCDPHLLYWSALSEIIVQFNTIWLEVENYLDTRKLSLPDTINLNLDHDYNLLFLEMKRWFERHWEKDFTVNSLIKIFEDEQVKTKLLPILFENWNLLREIKRYLVSKTWDNSELTTYWKNRYILAIEHIDDYLSNNFLTIK